MKKAKVKTVKAKARPKTKRVRVGSGLPGDRPVERSREERLRGQFAALGVMAKAINASRDAQARRDWERVKADEDGPMISAPVWHVHTNK